MMRYSFLAMLSILTVCIGCGGVDDNGTKPDPTAPTITAVTPVAGTVGAAPGAAITATFSEDMNASTITASTFTLDNGATGTVNYANRVATFTPTTPLPGYTRYTATITTGVTDLAGNALAQNYSWSFSGASRYFPMADGDTWYFTAADDHKVTRVVSGDTTITSHVCKRVLENDTTAEAWLIDSTGFYFHLLDGILRAEPPLKIPFHMAVNEIYPYAATLYWTENDTAYSAPVAGDMKFSGYVSHTVPAGIFPEAVKFLYITDGYSEYYVNGLGLIDNDDYKLDSAYVGGVWYRP
ncbi:MAG: Ig-like domain-containing protein [candidate division Zixibacteria bacterium]|nr:Ig-like domain-containing protein [candidate division Zixibacteria bacterium]